MDYASNYFVTPLPLILVAVKIPCKFDGHPKVEKVTVYVPTDFPLYALPLILSVKAEVWKPTGAAGFVAVP